MHSSHFIGGLWGRPAPVVKALATDLANRPFAPTLVFHETLLSFPRSRIGLLRLHIHDTRSHGERSREKPFCVFSVSEPPAPCRTRFGGCVRAETSKIMLMLMAMRDHQDGDVGAVFSTSVTRQPSH